MDVVLQPMGDGQREVGGYGVAIYGCNCRSNNLWAAHAIVGLNRQEQQTSESGGGYR
jgi:hypothetical protein